MKKFVLVMLIVALLLPAAGTASADTVYVVQRGDTLSRIAQNHGVAMAAIMAANNITNPNLIFVGQRLIIPGPGGGTGATPPPPITGQVHVVQRGDTLSRIAARYGVGLAAIMSANNISNANLIFVGQRLTIPGSGSPVVTPAPTAPPSGTPAPPAVGRYTVQRGDTLWSISQRFNTSVAAIMAANGLANSIIYIGQVLNIPGGGSSGQPPAPPATGGSFETGGQVNEFNQPDKMKNAGMFWVKRQVRWSPGATPNDGVIVDAHNKGFKILLSVLGSPADISGGANYDDYANYVGELARMGADAIEVWNEMNIDREWPAGQINPASYTDLLRRSWTQIKAKNAATLVISGAPAPTGAEGAFGLDRVWNDERYIAGMAAAGAASYMDCIGVHYNEGIISPTLTSGDPRDNYFTRYYGGMAAKYYAAFGGARQLCFTEIGYLTGEGYGSLPAAFGWAGNTTVAQQAQWLGEAASLAKASGRVRLFIVFNVDFTHWGDDPQAGYGIIRPGGACPACDSLRAVTGGR